MQDIGFGVWILGFRVSVVECMVVIECLVFSTQFLESGLKIVAPFR